MNKLLSLLKATMSDGIQLFNYHGKTERSKRIMPILLAIAIASMMLLSGVALESELKEAGAESAILSLYAIATTVIIIMEGIYKSADLLFRPRDNDTLLAMPIKKSTIVAARIIKFYAFELIYCLIFLLPAIIAYAMYAETSASYYLVAITALLLLPTIPIAISCVIGAVITMISGRFKHKVLLQVILSFVFLFALAIFVVLANSSSDLNSQTIVAINDGITKKYYPAAAFADLATNFSILRYLLFVAIHLAVLTITVLIIGKFYSALTNIAALTKQTKQKATAHKYYRHSQFYAIIKKEMVKYFNTPVLLVNTAMGLVMFIVAIVAVCLRFDDIAMSLSSSIEDFPLSVDDLSSYLPIVTVIMIAFASLMTYITATSISLEGKAFNLLKTLPISGSRVILAKVMAAMLLIVPVTLIGSIVMAFRFQFSVIDTVLILIAVIAMPLVTELAGVLIDLKYARFDAESDAIVVRQSASVMISTILGLGMFFVSSSIAVGATLLAGQTAGLAIIDGVFVVASLFLLLAIGTKGESRYLNLST